MPQGNGRITAQTMTLTFFEKDYCGRSIVFAARKFVV